MNPQSLFTSAIINKVRINDANMIGADLVDADLSNLQADRLNLRGANLFRTKLCAVRLGHCNLEGAQFESADFTNAILRMCVLDDGQGAGACFNNAQFEDSTAKGARLTGVKMKEAKLTETSFERAVLRDATFDGAEGDGVEFRGADLRGATLIGARFNDADFRGADLRGANLSKGCFQYSDFRGALLDGVLFDGADFSGAMFDANEGPNAVSIDTEKSRKADEFPNAIITLLSDGLTDLPNVFVDNKDIIQDVTNRLKQASDTFKATSNHSPEEWGLWVESFLALTKDKENVDLETIIEALYKGPVKFLDQSLLSTVSKDEMLNHMRDLSNLLNSTAQEPPEEWKLILEPLMKKAKAGGVVDFKTLLELLPNWVIKKTK
jgi:uncharacterized protein YjbI with pentapeptide repeats